MCMHALKCMHWNVCMHIYNMYWYASIYVNMYMYVCKYICTSQLPMLQPWEDTCIPIHYSVQVTSILSLLEENCSQDISAQNNLLKNSAVEYYVPVWCRSIYIPLHTSMHIIAGTQCPTQLLRLPVLSNITPVYLQQKEMGSEFQASGQPLRIPENPTLSWRETNI